MSNQISNNKSTWSWVPSLYFAEGIPYIIVMFVASDMYKTMGIPNSTLAFWTSLLYLPWTLKPLWSPFVDTYSTKRKWIYNMQYLLGLAFIGISIGLHFPWWFPITLMFLWVMAFVSSTHDIAADGFYMLALNEHDQAFFTGIRSTFYRLAMIAGLGLLVILTGIILDNTGLETVKLNIEAMSQSKISETVQTESNQNNKVDEVRILVSPSNIKVPLYNNNDLNPCDSVNVYFTLSGPPVKKENIKMSFGHKKGSQDISLERGDLIEFTKDNWNIPQKATIKVNHNLEEEASARFDAKAGNIPFSWSVSIGFLGILFLLFGLYHRSSLPRPESEPDYIQSHQKSTYAEIFISFFNKKGILVSIAFLLLYRFSESQLTKMASPFLLDSREAGGLALSLTEKGFAYGTVGLGALLVGGISGGLLAANQGLKKWIWWMAIAINVPNTVYIFMSYVQPDSRILINSCIAIEQFGYGFGFTGYMLYMLYIAGQGEHKTAHFAICTSFMALGMMIPGMISGVVQEALGYQNFFIYVIICTIPSFIALSLIKIDPSFGIKKK